MTVRIRIRAVPGGGRNSVVGRYGDAWKVRIAAAPERGRANDALCAFIASVVGVNRRMVQVVGGSTSRDKVLAIEGTTAASVDAAFEVACAGT